MFLKAHAYDLIVLFVFACLILLMLMYPEHLPPQ
jgi:hypothetical protein